MARYRSGHNGAVLKTVDGDEPSVGSNLTRAANVYWSPSTYDIQNYLGDGIGQWQS